MGINDDADTIVAELIVSQWGLPGSSEEAVRMDLIQLSTTRAMRSKALRSTWTYCTAKMIRPISFMMGPFRVTRGVFLPYAIVFMGLILALFLGEFYHL